MLSWKVKREKTDDGLYHSLLEPPPMLKTIVQEGRLPSLLLLMVMMKSGYQYLFGRS